VADPGCRPQEAGMNDWVRAVNELFRKMLFLPEQASTLAGRIDRLHYFVFAVTMLSSVVVGLAAVYFMFRYRERKKNASTPVVSPSVRFETVVIAIPLLFFLVWVFVGFKDYVWYTAVPKNAMDVYVTGKKWMWHFAYPDGPNANATLTVPAGRPVRLLMTSRDVIHSFFVPEFRIKQDVVPGRYTETWFQATKAGRYRVYCTEYCGTWHSQMLGEVVVLEPGAFDAWMARQREGLVARNDSSGGAEFGRESFRGDLITHGRRLASVHGCFKCHSLDGQPHIGPTWIDLYRRKTVLQNDQTLVADEGYLTESMMDPYTKMVKGFAQVMPSYRGKLTAPEAAALVEFIKSLRSDSLENVPAKEPVYGPVQRR
jgi:cytochrome c oxidase subunit 2